MALTPLYLADKSALARMTHLTVAYMAPVEPETFGSGPLGWDQFSRVGMQHRQSSVEGHQRATEVPSQRHEIRVSHLAVSDHTCEDCFVVADLIGPEIVLGQRRDLLQRGKGVARSYSLPQQEAKQSSLGGRTSG